MPDGESIFVEYERVFGESLCAPFDTGPNEEFVAEVRRCIAEKIPFDMDEFLKDVPEDAII